MSEFFESGETTSMSRRLRILHVMPSLNVGGAEQMAAHLMIGLSAMHQVGAVGLSAATNSAIEHRLAEASISKWHLNKRTGFDPRMFSSLRRIFRDFQPDIVHTHMAVQRYVFPVLFGNRIAASVHTIHNLAQRETDAFGRLVHWFAFRNHVLPVGISQEVAATVRFQYGVKCEAVIPNCIPVERYRSSASERIGWRDRVGLSRDAIVFTSVARLERQKNPLLLLKAFSELNDSRAHLMLVGDGALRGHVSAYVRNHKLGRVHLLGKQDDVPGILAASDVFVLASDWEGNPLAVMEAMAAGLPVIATKVGGVPELVRSAEHGLLVQPGDHAAFTAAMKSLLDDSGKRLAMSTAARERAMREFKLERMVEKYGDLYQEVVIAFRNQRINRKCPGLQIQ